MANDPGGPLEPRADPFSTGRPRSFAVAVVDAPWGPVHLAAGADAILGIAVLAPGDAFVADVERRTGRSVAPAVGAFLDRAAEAVEAFLAGRPSALVRLPVDLGDRGLWDRAVLAAVRDVGWGRITSYGRVARAIGRPGAARAAGAAIGRNPVGLAIPCHRVIAADGSIGGYGGDWFGPREALLEIKRELLATEGIHLPAGDRLG